MEDGPRIAIIGGGVSGISLARLLMEANIKRVTIYEAEPRPGGKSVTINRAGALFEMGTCYTTLSQAIVKRWMVSQGVKLTRLGAAKFDGANFLAYVKKGAGPPLPLQAALFLRAGYKFRQAIASDIHSQALLDEASTPILDWLHQRNLPKMELFLHRVMTAQGYGFLDEVTVLQAFRWCDTALFLSGALNQLHLPDIGWQEFWAKLAHNMDLRSSARVTSVVRSDTGILVKAVGQREEQFDQIVCAMPLDEFTGLLEPSRAETIVNNGIIWNNYTTSLIAADDWHTKWTIDAYSAALKPGAAIGQLIGGRYEGCEPELGGNLYITGQLSKDFTDEELAEVLRADLTTHGAKLSNLILQKTWKYFPMYKPEAIRAGLVQTMRQMQGENHTWYTGATFSHESVANIVNFNVDLVRDMQAHFASRPIDELV